MEQPAITTKIGFFVETGLEKSVILVHSHDIERRYSHSRWPAIVLAVQSTFFRKNIKHTQNNLNLH